MSLNDINSLSHTKWDCKYHIVFAPKYRRKVFCKEKRAASNYPCAAARPYYTFTRYARNRGLCPHRKNPQFYWGVTFLCRKESALCHAIKQDERQKDGALFPSACAV